MNCCGLFFSLILFLLPMDMDAQEKQINGTNLGESPAQAIDLGLPSGIKWASCNVGAFKVEEYGDFFAWGETIPKKNFTEENYNTLIKENTFLLQILVTPNMMWQKRIGVVRGECPQKKTSWN